MWKCLLGQENRECQDPDRSKTQKALEVKLSHPWSKATPLFDDEHLVSDAGLVPVMALAEQAGLSELVAERVEEIQEWVRVRVVLHRPNPHLGPDRSHILLSPCPHVEERRLHRAARLLEPREEVRL